MLHEFLAQSPFRCILCHGSGLVQSICWSVVPLVHAKCQLVHSPFRSSMSCIRSRAINLSVRSSYIAMPFIQFFLCCQFCDRGISKTLFLTFQDSAPIVSMVCDGRRIGSSPWHGSWFISHRGEQAWINVNCHWSGIEFRTTLLSFPLSIAFPMGPCSRLALEPSPIIWV